MLFFIILLRKCCPEGLWRRIGLGVFICWDKLYEYDWFKDFFVFDYEK